MGRSDVGEGVFDPVPAEHRDKARSALAAVFGAAAISTIAPLSGGASGAYIFRVRSGARQVLLRIEGIPSPLRNPHQYVSMQIASDAGIAPRLLYVNETDRVAVMDVIEERPLRDFPGGQAALSEALGQLLRRLQATPAFPQFVDYGDIVSRLFAHVVRTGLFADGLLAPHVAKLEHIRTTLAWDQASLVSSHNDANPRNILFDGNRLWLIDWESAYRNDPLVDVAVMLDNLAPTPELEAVLLRSWLGRAPDAAILERLDPIRALTRLYFAGVLLSASATAPRSAPYDDLSAPSLAELVSAVRAGRVVRSFETANVMGKMYLASFLSGAPVPPLDLV
ncbi:MAG TPA: phosphotransferase [Rhizomicrobium sp.]|nr:phosphotransferase [Rhizomicrobium sp.]